MMGGLLGWGVVVVTNMPHHQDDCNTTSLVVEADEPHHQSGNNTTSSSILVVEADVPG